MSEELSDHLVGWLLGTSAVPPSQLCRDVVNRAAERLQGGEPDRKALTKDLRTARLFLSHVRDSCKTGSLESVTAKLLQNVCLPYLNLLLENCSDCTTADRDVREVAEATAAALLSPDISPAAAEEAFRKGLCPLLRPRDSAEQLACLTSFLCELFSKAKPENLQDLPGFSEQLSAMFTLFLSLLDHASAVTSHLILSSLLPFFITPSHPHHLSAVWALVGEVWRGERIVELHPLVLLLSLLCCFSDVFISQDHTSPFLSTFPRVVTDLCPLLDVRGEAVFWEVLGAGLRSSSSLDRKKAMYLLTRVLSSVRGGEVEVVSEGGVFWWRCQNDILLTEVWDDLILLLQTMEEKQVHIVKPVKNRMRTIIQATTTFIDGLSLLHVCWLELALERVFLHSEAKSIVRWGVCEALSLDLSSSPLLLPTHWQFVYGPLLTALSNAKLFCRDSPTDLRPSVATLFTSFLERFLANLSLDLRGDFLHGFLQALKTNNVSDAPLLHMTHSLSLLSPSPLLSPSSLLVVRSIISHLDTLRPLLRAAVMTFLITAAKNLSDMSQGVGWQEIACLLGGVNTLSCLPFSSYTWRKMCEWTSAMNAVSATPICSYLTVSLTSHLNPLSQEVAPPYHSLSRLSLLAVDAQLISSPSLERLLEPVMSVVSTALSRPYLSSHTLTLSLLTLNSFLSTFLSGSSLTPDLWQGGQSDTGRLIYKTLLPWLPDMIQTVQGLLLRGRVADQLSLTDITLLTASLSSLHTFSSLYGFSWSTDISPTHLMTSALCTLHSVLSSNDLQRLELTCGVVGGLGAVGWVCQLDIELPPSTFSSLLSIPPHLSLCRPSETSASEQSGCGFTEWGPLVDWCEAQHWTAILFCLSHQSCDPVRSEGWDSSDIWDLCAENVECVESHRLPVLLDCLSLALPFVESKKISATIQDCWRCVQDSWSSLSSFLPLLLHRHLLFSSDSCLVDLVEKICREVLEVGERRAGVANVLSQALCAGWRQERERGGAERVVQSLLRHRELLLQLCCFGGAGRRCMRSLEDGEEFVRLLGDQIAANSTCTSGLHGDSGVRVTVLSFLVGVATREDTAHFLYQFCQDIMEKVLELSASKPRYFINSLTHRLKQRLLQTLLLLLPHLPPEGDEELVKETLRALQADNQTSVRHLLEWTAILLLARQPHLVPSLLLPTLQPDSEFRLSRLQSLFTVAVHLVGAWDPPHRESYCKSLLPLVFPWTTCHHFVVRLYAQKTTEVVWEAGRKGKERESEESLIDSCICFMREHSDAARFSHKLEANVGFSVLRPLTDLSVQALFDCLPRLCGVIYSECVRVEDFQQCWEELGEVQRGTGKSVPLYCDNRELLEMVKRGRMGEGEEAKGDDTRSIAHQLMVEDGVGEEDKKRDVQKKITRWSSGAGVLEELFPGQRFPVEMKPGGLVVVASLLTKIPNLGGLCRTCEIFGAGELVVSSLSVLQDPQFSALSVSAQHWLNMTEVRLPELPSYLLAMRRAGYRLVGAEQTAQSKSMRSYSFHPLTLLLLGNEREGIPVQLLHMLDECVEIPQFGVIRSLNVHVSGALLVWEYCKQHLLQTDSAS